MESFELEGGAHVTQDPDKKLQELRRAKLQIDSET